MTFQVFQSWYNQKFPQENYILKDNGLIKIWLYKFHGARFFMKEISRQQ